MPEGFEIRSERLIELEGKVTGGQSFETIGKTGYRHLQPFCGIGLSLLLRLEPVSFGLPACTLRILLQLPVDDCRLAEDLHSRRHRPDLVFPSGTRAGDVGLTLSQPCHVGREREDGFAHGAAEQDKEQDRKQSCQAEKSLQHILHGSGCLGAFGGDRFRHLLYLVARLLHGGFQG